MEFQVPIVSILLIQVEGDEHLLLRERAEGGGHYFDFTDSGEVVWTDDEGRVCLGNSTGYQCYEAPSPALQVWYISEGMVLVQDSHEELWRFNPDRGKWEPIPGFQGEIRGLGVSTAGDYALIFQQDRLWGIPLAPGERAKPVPMPGFSLVGIDTLREVPVIPLEDAGSWFVGAPIWSGIESEVYPVEGFIYNLEEHRFLTADDFALPAGARAIGFDVSPDGQWIGVIVEGRAADGVYIASASDMALGRMVEEVRPFGWREGEHSFLTNDFAFLEDEGGT